jgi:hypothetical protein
VPRSFERNTEVKGSQSMNKDVDMRRVCGAMFDNRVEFDVFPATRSNAITYECFCLMGGLENLRMHKVHRANGTDTYFTYHDISRR